MSTATTTDLAAVFDRAAFLIDTQGWVQGRMYDRDGSRCALGALRDASHTPILVKASTALLEAFAEGASLPHPAYDDDTPNQAYRIVRWNDAEGRTQQDVVDALKRAAEAFRGGAE